MKIPKGMTEVQVWEVIEKLIKGICPKFVFGCFELEDIKQQARIECIKGLESYNGLFPLANFLSVHLRNRLNNFRRNNFRRSEPPCQTCHNAKGGITKHRDKKYCKKYNNWLKVQNTRQNLMYMLDITTINNDREKNAVIHDNVLNNMANQEMLEQIDIHLPVKYRKTYLQLLDNYPVSKAKREELFAVIQGILNE